MSRIEAKSREIGIVGLIILLVETMKMAHVEVCLAYGAWFIIEAIVPLEAKPGPWQYQSRLLLWLHART